MIRLIIVLFIFCSCTPPSRVPKSEYTMPLIEHVKNQELSFFVFNNLQVKQAKQTPHMQIGGEQIIDKYLKIIRSKLNNALIISNGPNTYDDSEGLSSLEKWNFDAINLTEEEITYGHEERKLPFITTNILNLKTNNTYRRHKTQSQIVKKVNGEKIAFLGITNFKEDRVDFSGPFNGLNFEDPTKALVKKLRKLKRKGIKTIIVLTNIRSECKIKDGKFNCPEEDHLLNLLKRVPHGGITAIINTSDNHFATEYNGIPVINFKGPELFAHLNLNPETGNKSFRLVKLCHKFYKATNDCYLNPKEKFYEKKFEEVKETGYKLIPATFLSETID